jgi:hypothetical protein
VEKKGVSLISGAESVPFTLTQNCLYHVVLATLGMYLSLIAFEILV